MKTVIYIFTFVLMSLPVSAQDLEKIMSDYSKLPNVVDIAIPDLSPSMIKMDVNDEQSAKVISKIKAMRIIVLSDCPQSEKEKFSNTFATLKMSDYELLLKTKDDDEDIFILSKSKGEIIQEIVIVSNDIDEPTIIQLKGEFSMSDLPDIEKEFGQKKSRNV